MGWDKKVKFLNQFSSDLKRSGHVTSSRRTILTRVVLKYKTDLTNHVEGKKCLYRTGVERQQQKEMRGKQNQNDTWFRSGGATSTLTVPTTPGGCLADDVRKSLLQGRQPLGTKIKVIEDGGVSSRVGLVKTNQFPKDECGRGDCVLCQQRGGEGHVSNCWVNNIAYEGECTRCPEPQVYVGETSRAAHTRIKEHIDNYRAAAASRLPALDQTSVVCGKSRCVNMNKCRCNVKSWMWEHSRDHHGGVVGDNGGLNDYRMSVKKKFVKCLDRQVFEDVRMQHCLMNGGTLLNSKNEYYTPKSVQVSFKQW